MKLWSTHHCSSAIYIQETGVQREKYRGLGHDIHRSVRYVDRRFSCPPYSITTIYVFSNFGAMV